MNEPLIKPSTFAVVAFAVFLVWAICTGVLQEWSGNAPPPPHATHVARTVAVHPSPQPSLVASSDSGSSEWVGWLAFLLAGVCLLTLVLFVQETKHRFSELKEDCEKVGSGHNDLIAELESMNERLSRFSTLAHDIDSELPAHRKMLRILKRMPSYQVQAALVAANEVAKDPLVAKAAQKELDQAQTQSQWEEDSQVTNGN